MIELNILIPIIGCTVLFEFILTLIIYKYIVDSKYRHFYIIPSIAMYKSMLDNKPIYITIGGIILTVIYELVYLPLSLLWMIAWLILKPIKSFIEETTQEFKAQEEIEKSQEENKLFIQINELDKTLENPEYISKEFLDRQRFESAEYMEYLKQVNNKEIDKNE